MKSSKRSPLLRLAAQAWLAIAGLHFLWEAMNYRGFFGRLAELQIHYFGAYAPLLTFLFLFGLAALPAWLLLRILRRREQQEQSPSEMLSLQIKRGKRLRTILYSFAAATTVVVAAFIVFVLFMLPSPQGNVQTIAASDVGTIAVKEGPARMVGGEIGTIVFFGQDWFIGDDRMAFAPYRAAGKDGRLARVFVQLEAKSKTQLASITQRPAWSGILVEGGLPGTARVLFNSLGVGISDPYYTLYRDEYSLKIRYWLQAIQWTILAVFLLIFARMQTRRVKKLEEERGELVA
jgi:membrane protein implicated in regulation of membrane protease activity